MVKIRSGEMQLIENVLDMGSGNVLDFSDATFGRFFDNDLGIDIDDDRYRDIGTSKGKRFRSFLKQENEATVARALRALWDYRSNMRSRWGQEDDPAMSGRFFDLVHRLEGDSGIPNTDAIDRFSTNETLEELVAAIGRDAQANKPQAALDRLHTYCMKKFAHLLQARGISCNRDDPLHSRAGKYVKALEAEGQVRPISLRIMKNVISVFDLYNGVRNNETFAHDNELVELHEARFIFDSIGSMLRFMRNVEATRFGA